MEKQCAVCGNPPEGRTRSNWRTCSDSCRKAWQRYREDVVSDSDAVAYHIKRWVSEADTMFKLRFVIGVIFSLYRALVREFERASDKAEERANEQGLYWGRQQALDSLATALRRNGE